MLGGLACVTKVACFRLEILTPGPANQPPDGAHDPAGIPAPAPAARTERALRSAPEVLVRGVGVPAYAEADASIVMQHGLRRLPGP